MDKLNEISESKKFENDNDNIEIQEFFRSKIKLSKPILFNTEKQISRIQKINDMNSDDNNMNGSQLKELRAKMGFTQEKISNLLGIDKVYVFRYEKNVKIPTSKKRIIDSFLKTEIVKKGELKDFNKLKSKTVEPDLFNIENQINEAQQKQIIMNNIDIIKIRKEMGLTQQQFADLIEMDRRSIANWESGKVKVPESKIKLVELLLEKIKIKSSADSNVENSNDESVENLNREIMYLKDHVKTLKESIDDKNKLADIY